MYEREIALEAAELEEKPDEERDELALLYRAKGLDRADARRLAGQIMADRQVALDTLAREELGRPVVRSAAPAAPGRGGGAVTFGIGRLIGASVS